VAHVACAFSRIVAGNISYPRRTFLCSRFALAFGQSKSETLSSLGASAPRRSWKFCRLQAALVRFLLPAPVLDAMLEVRPSRPNCRLVGEVEVSACDQDQRVGGTDSAYAVFYFMELLQAVQVNVKKAGRFIAREIRLVGHGSIRWRIPQLLSCPQEIFAGCDSIIDEWPLKRALWTIKAHCIR
jgi:hypothetical protein